MVRSSSLPSPPNPPPQPAAGPTRFQMAAVHSKSADVLHPSLRSGAGRAPPEATRDPPEAGAPDGLAASDARLTTCGKVDWVIATSPEPPVLAGPCRWWRAR